MRHNIQLERRARGLTQEDFAHALGITVSTVNRWENGKASPSKLARRAIEAFFRDTPAQGDGATVDKHKTEE